MSNNTRFPNSNKEIRAKSVRLIGAESEMLGVVPIEEALLIAERLKLDLVEISPNAEPPVCKIMDFSRYKYESKKRLQESKKKQKRTSLKEMKFKVNIGQGDLEVKVRKIKGFLEEGDKVKVTLSFKGREIVHKDKGIELFGRILTELGEVAKQDQEPKMEGKQVIMVLSKNIQ